jgi:leucyl aminopeptidase
VPSPDGSIANAVFGLGAAPVPVIFGKLPGALPENTTWRLAPGAYDPAMALKGFCLGAYRFDRYKSATRGMARLAVTDAATETLQAVRSIYLARDLINTPANDLGPQELADAVMQLATQSGAAATRIDGAALQDGYPAIAAVGAGSDRAPVMIRMSWQGSDAQETSPLVSLCGKGVCFDTGGYDIKPSSGMVRMKKDMGGAAIALGLARLIMALDLPVRLKLRIGCAENSVSGHAMRPSDVIRTRRGLHVEVGNTDAEGRLVLADLLAEAADESPDFLIDFATLTGAARAALGPDLPALFCNDEPWAAQWAEAGTRSGDPVWRLPLWAGYESWNKSKIADLNNSPSKPMAGAIMGALFLQRFVRPGLRWAHLDTYAWNDSAQPGQPEGGEAQGLCAAFDAISLQTQQCVRPKLGSNGMKST